MRLTALSLSTLALGSALALVTCANGPQDSSKRLSGSTTPAAVLQSGFFDSDGLRIHYESFGTGRPLVLVHGWGADTQRNWIEPGWVDALKSERLMISLEPRGHGESDKPHDARAYSYSAMSRDVLALMDHLGIPKADYMGYSMGAFMGAYLLGHHADRFSAMILGGIGDETEESKKACYLIAEALRAPEAASVTDPVGRAYRTYVEASRSNDDLEALALSALQMWPEGYPLALGGEGLGRLRIPVLIVNGADDHPYVDSDERLAAAIPGAKLLTISGTDHMSTVADPRFKVAVLEFLAAN